MCGIIGIVGIRPAADRIVEGLKRLEYRGYDSAGIATVREGVLERRRAEGKLANLEGELASSPLPGTVGIGHTRWATHGAPVVRNAHPHLSDNVAVVHNGIIENFRELREELEADGYQFVSQTDTETVAHLVRRELSAGKAATEAARSAIAKLRGAFALAIVFADEPDLIVAARNGPPLAIGHGDDEMYLGSDAVALAPLTNRVTYLEDGDTAILGRETLKIHDASGSIVERPMAISSGAAMLVDKGNYRHFMNKEIHEQPEVVGHTLAHYLDLTTGRVAISEQLPFDFADLQRITIVACGTSFYAASVAKYWFERYANLPVEVDIASEYRYRDAPLLEDGLALFISQSGETADTLACLNHCKSGGQHIGVIVNVRESTMARAADAVFPTLAGPEIGVASSKAFTCQLATLAAIVIAAGVARGRLNEHTERELVHALTEAPRLLTEALALDDEIERVSKELSNARDVLYLGRDTSFPLAMEGALKLKEISYIHAEGYAGGELKHGPIALIDEDMPVIVLAPHDRIFEKTVSNMQEVAARGGRIILVTDPQGAKRVGIDEIQTIVLPPTPELIAPLIYSVPVQLLAYHTAVHMGTDVDQPRNLAKSVTVE